jgi:hypothetical protein
MSGSEATQQNLDDECVDVRAIMGLNDDQLRELGFSKMGHRSTIIQEQRRPPPPVAASMQPTLATCLQPSPAPVIVVAAVARPKTAISPVGRAAAELEERVKEKVAQDPRVADYTAELSNIKYPDPDLRNI